MNLERMARDLVFQHMLYHPLPWRIESDWTEEVTALDGFIVAKTDHQTAKEIIALAEAIRKELDEFNEEEEFLNDTGTTVEDVTSSSQGSRESPDPENHDQEGT